MSDLYERIKWILIHNNDPGFAAKEVIREIESTHYIVDPELITEEMLEACFNALPKHYDPPDPKRRAWHAYKARHRFTAMVRAVEGVMK